ncbi:zinc finger protein 830 isoform X2 [Erpetoichthys calabaricus]|uniref:zinc finger protein 830 isoform X2 n=1 Tax=Erpetoichthys calabaricus TaxID=27687 RepID=UPI00109F8E63|nr:zinc finger protein 830 isoform X2 [Erpetoichthys calabaricus]
MSKMATAKLGKGKKAVSQDELRRLMRQKQRETSQNRKRVESPFAKYNSLGHLTCVLCNTPIKSDILWQTHILGKPHKQKVDELKSSEQTSSPAPVSNTPAAVDLKRKAPSVTDPDVKKVKQETAHSTESDLPADFFDSKNSKGVCSSSVSQTPGLRLLANDYDDDDDEDNDGNENSKPVSGNGSLKKNTEIPPVVADKLPSDFFDSNVPIPSHSGSIQKAEESEKPAEKKENAAEALPEGFFDDPVKDAKVRNVDTPQDQMDKEWDEFQKEMRQVTNVSEAIVAEDDEQGRLDRQIGEIDEQIECYRRVEVLRDKQELFKESLKKQMKSTSTHTADETDSEGEEELQDLLSSDWRAKGTLLFQLSTPL